MCKRFCTTKKRGTKFLSKNFSYKLLFFFINWSGQRDLNPRDQPWQNFKFTANLNHSNDSQI